MDNMEYLGENPPQTQTYADGFRDGEKAAKRKYEQYISDLHKTISKLNEQLTEFSLLK